jgi:hypothetical protein
MALLAQAHGHAALLNFSDLPTGANAAAWQRFVFASALLAQTGHLYAQFAGNRNLDPQFQGLDIGAPTETWPSVDGLFQGGVYQRDFSSGKVLVNPSTSPVTVDLGGVYVDGIGNAGSTLVMPAFSGAVVSAVADAPGETEPAPSAPVLPSPELAVFGTMYHATAALNLPAAGHVTVQIRGADDTIVRRRFVDGAFPIGSFTRLWYGRDDAGRLMPPGLYRFVLTFETASGTSILSTDANLP